MIRICEKYKETRKSLETTHDSHFCCCCKFVICLHDAVMTHYFVFMHTHFIQRKENCKKEKKKHLILVAKLLFNFKLPSGCPSETFRAKLESSESSLYSSLKT